MILNVENPKTPKICHLGWAIRPALTGPRPRPIKFLGKGVLPSLPNPSSPLSQKFPPTFFISISRSNPNPETKTDIRDSEFENTSATRKMNLCRAGRSSLNALRASKLVSPHRPISPLLLRHSHVLPPPFAAAAVRHLRTGREPPVRYPIVGTPLPFVKVFGSNWWNLDCFCYIGIKFWWKWNLFGVFLWFKLLAMEWCFCEMGYWNISRKGRFDNRAFWGVPKAKRRLNFYFYFIRNFDLTHWIMILWSVLIIKLDRDEIYSLLVRDSNS